MPDAVQLLAVLCRGIQAVHFLSDRCGWPHHAHAAASKHSHINKAVPVAHSDTRMPWNSMHHVDGQLLCYLQYCVLCGLQVGP